VKQKVWTGTFQVSDMMFTCFFTSAFGFVQGQIFCFLEWLTRAWT